MATCCGNDRLGSRRASIPDHLENRSLDLIHDPLAPPARIGVESCREAVRACEMESATPALERFDPVGAIEDIVKATTHDDVFVESGLRDELRIRLDREGEFRGRFPVGHDLVKGNVAFHRRLAFSADSRTIQDGGAWTGESEQDTPIRTI